MVKNKQMEMKIKIKLDSVGKAAERYMAVRNAKENIVERLSKEEKNLIGELKKAKREFIRVGGILLNIQFQASKEKIVVKK